MSKFRVGDTVRCIDNSRGEYRFVKVGDVYRVTDLMPPIACVGVEGVEGGHSESRFELAEPELFYLIARGAGRKSPVAYGPFPKDAAVAHAKGLTEAFGHDITFVLAKATHRLSFDVTPPVPPVYTPVIKEI